MATLTQQLTAVATESFRYRVSMAMYKIAREVLFENPAIDQHHIRVNFAMGVINSDYNNHAKYAALVVADPLIADVPVPANGVDGISDGVICDCIRRMWNPLAGIAN